MKETKSRIERRDEAKRQEADRQIDEGLAKSLNLTIDVLKNKKFSKKERRVLIDFINESTDADLGNTSKA